MGKSYIDNPTHQSPVVSANLVDGDDFTESWKCTVTDSVGQSVTVNVPVHFIKVNGGQPLLQVIPSNSIVLSSPILTTIGVQMNLSLENIPGPVQVTWRNMLDSSAQSMIFQDGSKTSNSIDPFILTNLTIPNQIVNEVWEVIVTDANNVTYTETVHTVFKHEPITLPTAVVQKQHVLTNDGLVVRWLMNTRFSAEDIVQWQDTYFEPHYTGGGVSVGDYGAVVTSNNGIAEPTLGYVGPYDLVSRVGFFFVFTQDEPTDNQITLSFRNAPENEVVGTLTVPLVYAPEAWLTELN